MLMNMKIYENENYFTKKDTKFSSHPNEDKNIHPK